MLNDKSLLRLVRRNWVNIWSLKNIINSLANPRRSIKSLQFGKNEANDQDFIKNLRLRLPTKYLELLGINNIANKGLMRELQILNEGIVSGSPRVEIKKPCPPKKCRKVYREGSKTCPEPIIKVMVRQIQVDVCENNEIKCIQNIRYLPKQCGMSNCMSITTEYCNMILNNLESE